VPAGEELSTSFNAHPRAWVLSVALSADGKLLATSGTDNKARVGDAATNKLLATVSDWSMIRTALAPDSKTLAAAANHLRLWEPTTGRNRGVLTEVTVSGPLIEAVAFSPDGKWLACAGHPNRVRVWSMEDKKEKHTFGGHAGDVLALALSSDGRAVASG